VCGGAVRATISVRRKSRVSVGGRTIFGAGGGGAIAPRSHTIAAAAESPQTHDVATRVIAAAP
jgi:hypothetical protein